MTIYDRSHTGASSHHCPLLPHIYKVLGPHLVFSSAIAWLGGSGVLVFLTKTAVTGKVFCTSFVPSTFLLMSLSSLSSCVPAGSISDGGRGSFSASRMVSSFLPAIVLLERRRARGPPCVVASMVWVARRTFLVLRTTSVLTLAGVTALSSVLDTPLEGGAVGRAELVAFVLLERPGIFSYTPHALEGLNTNVKSLHNRARGIINTQDNLQKEVDHLVGVLKQNGLPANFIRNASSAPPHRKQQTQACSRDEEQEERGPLVVVPYVAGMSEDSRRVCRKFKTESPWFRAVGSKKKPVRPNFHKG